MLGSKFYRQFCWLVLFTLAVLLAAAPVYAADPTLTPTQQKAFDRTVAAADSAGAAQLTQQYRDYESLLRTSQEWDRKIEALRSQNAQREANIRKRIPEIDAPRLDQLKRAYESAKTQYQKTRAMYQSINQQYEVAKKMKNSWLADVLKLQANLLKMSTEQARIEMKAREAAHQAAKKAADAKKKNIRDTLSGIQQLQTRVRAAKSALKSPRDSRGTVWKSFTSSLTKQDTPSATRFLTSVNQLTRQIIDQQQKIYALESQIADTLFTAQRQLNQLS